MAQYRTERPLHTLSACDGLALPSLIVLLNLPGNGLSLPAPRRALYLGGPNAFWSQPHHPSHALL